MFNIGLSTGYFHAYEAIFDFNFDTDTEKEKDARPYYGEGIQNFTYIQFFTDFKPSIFLIQLGLGPYISLKENSLNKVYFGANLKLGVEFPILSFLSIPLVTQFQIVILENTKKIIFPIKVLLGLKFIF